MLLEDKMSQPLMNIDNSLSVVSASIERVQAVATTMFGTASLTVTRAQLNAAKISVDGIGSGIEKANNEQNKLHQTSEKLTEELDGSCAVFDAISKKLEGVSKSIKEAFSVEKIIGLSDQMVQTSARINMMNDGMQTNKELQDMIFRSAQNSGAAYQTTADRVAGLSNNAKGVFDSTSEIVDFAELVSKQFAIAGASTEDTNSAFSQLTQALDAGVLSGDDLNSIFAEAPNMIQTIADYLNVPVAALDDMAAGGQLTADIVKNAMLASTDDINNKFNSMPMTWEQVGNTIKNQGLMAIQPILEKFSEIANNPSFQEFAAGVVYTISNIAGVLAWVLDLAITGASAICDNWSIIGPIIYGIGAALLVYKGYLLACSVATQTMKAAQVLLNIVMGMNPVMLIVLGVIALIAVFYAVIGVINQLMGTSISATGIIVGCLYTAVAFIWNLFLGILDLVLGIVNFLVNLFVTFANFFANVFKNPVSSVIYLFQGMADGVLGVLEKIASAMDFVFGSNMADTVAGWRVGLKTMADDVVAKYAPNEDYKTVMDGIDLSAESLGFTRKDYGDAYNAGYDYGNNIGGKSILISKNTKGTGSGANDYTDSIPTITDLSGTQAGADIGNTAENTANLAKSVSDSTEEIKYLRDIAEREVINRFTTAEIKVNMGGIHNKVNKNTDIDGVVTHLENKLYESLNSTAEQYNS
jgi:tape measure domain-containing protein